MKYSMSMTVSYTILKPISHLHNGRSLDVMVRAVGTSRLLTIFYILCLAITWISTEMKFEDIKPISKYVLYI